jgi:hypothetical protein
MQNESNLKGEWFLPEDLNNKLSGILNIKPFDRISLELIGSFDNPIDQMKFIARPIIQGISTKGEKITLCNCQIINVDSALSNLPETTYLIHLVAIGDHYKEESLICGNKVRARFNLLEKWVNIYGYKIDFKTQGQLKLTSDNLDNISFNIDFETTGKFIFTSTYNIFPSPEFRYVQRTLFELESKNGQTAITDFLIKLQHFKKFMTVGIAEEISIISITLFTIPNENSTKKTIEIFISQDKPIDAINERDINNFMFTYKDIETDFENIISNWFNNKLDRVINTIYLYHQNRTSYPENTLLDGAQGLESFHRRLRQETDKLKQDFSIKLDRICDNLDPSDCKFLRAKLEYGYEPNLRKRLKELISMLDPDIAKVFFKDQNGITTFINKLVDSRNYYTHYSDSLEKTAAKGADLVYLAQKTNLFLIILVLLEIGFSIEKLKIILDRYYYKISYFL